MKDRLMRDAKNLSASGMMGNMKKLLTLFLIFWFMPQAVWAGVEHLSLMYGVFPTDIALAGAVAASPSTAGAAYHNPAALANLDGNILAVSYLFLQPRLRGGPADAQNDFDHANNIITLGLDMPLGQILANTYPIGMGVTLSVDDGFSTIVAFENVEHENGYFLRYGKRSFSFAHGLGVQVVDGLNLGVGYLLGYTARVTIVQDIEILGSTENEQISLLGRLAFFPLAGLQWQADSFHLGLVYRAEMLARVDPVSGDTTPKVAGTPVKAYPTEMKFLDGYTPHQFVAGVELFPHGIWSLDVQAEALLWSRFNRQLYTSNATADDLELKAHDIFLPRIGLRWRPDSTWEVRGGYAYEPSPFDNLGGNNHLALDSDRHRFGLGGGYTRRFSWLKAPLTIDAALLVMPLESREERNADNRLVHVEGLVIGGTAGIVFRY